MTPTDPMVFPREQLESKYRLLISWRNSTIDFLGLPSYEEVKPVSIEALYVALRLGFESDGRGSQYLGQFLQQNRRLVVFGDPGAGKSTLVRMIAYSLGREEPAPLAQTLGRLVPIPIVLRDYQVRAWEAPLDMLLDLARSLKPEIEIPAPEIGNWLLDVLRSGRGVLMLDGMDEAGTVEDRKRLCERVLTPLLAEAGDSVILLTSRMAGYSEAPYEACGLRRAFLAPFGDEEVREYIRRWYAIREPDRSRREQAVRLLTGDILGNPALTELARKPGLLALMALIYRATGALPLDRLRLYDKFVEASLETVQAHRRLPSFGASLEQMKRWLGAAAWEMQSRRGGESGGLSAKRSEVIDWIAGAIGGEPGAAKQLAERFVDFVTRRGGLLVPLGPEDLAFAHLSFQEYFAAWRLRAEIRRFEHLTEEVLRLVRDPGWHEVLVLLLGMLAEFPGAIDDLVQETVARTEKDQNLLPALASLFVRLLAREESELGASRQAVRDVVFEAWAQGALPWSGDLLAFYKRFSGEYAEWAAATRVPAPRLAASHVETGDRLVVLGASEDARLCYEKAIALEEPLARAEPGRADYQRDLSVSYERMGDLLVSAGEGERAREFYQKASEISERLARAEPGRADYQRDLAVSYGRMGDLLVMLGQGERAREFYQKAMETSERLARAEPGRTDYQQNLLAALVRRGDRDSLVRALEIAERLQREGKLEAAQSRWVEGLQAMISDLEAGAAKAE